MKRQNLIELAQRLEKSLREQGVSFLDTGLPKFPEEIVFRGEPGDLLTFSRRYEARDKKRTILCHFENDEKVYKRLFSLDKEIEIYKEYQGMAGFDLSPRIDWDLNLQWFNILLNRLADVYVGLKGVKILPNFRTGSLETFEVFDVYPDNVPYAVGALGCLRGDQNVNDVLLRFKTICVRPSALYYYGKITKSSERILQDFGIPIAFLKITEDDFLKGKTMSDAKRDYSENVKRRKEDALLDEKLTKTIQEGYKRREDFGDNWESVNINEVVAEIAPNGKREVRNGKVFFTNKEEASRCGR